MSIGGTSSNTSRITAAMKGITMIERISPAVIMPMPSGGPENRVPIRGMLPNHVDHQGLDVGLHQRREDEQAPHAVDDRRDRRQQLDRRAERALEPAGRELGQEQRDAEADRNGDHHRDQRGHQRAVDRHQRAEFLPHRDSSPGARGSSGRTCAASARCRSPERRGSLRGC